MTKQPATVHRLQEKSLNDAMPREELHQRRIELRAWRRGDGLIEVEGRLLDTKGHPFRRQLAAADVPPGQPLHDITVTMLVDRALVVQAVRAQMATTPFDLCPGAAAVLDRLRGQTLGAGWNRRVRELLARDEACTHIVELLGPMATTVHQALAPERLAALNQSGSDAERQRKVGSCYAYAAEREVVARLWPQLHRPRAGD
ncbi:MAG: DUF2889 domain-containing protein [Proteobacteria bacterium]|nr:DUF2889 domain-containing protein [Pseudomonadota bacterium]